MTLSQGSTRQPTDEEIKRVHEWEAAQKAIANRERRGGSRGQIKWPARGYVPCVHCSHLRGDHSKTGECVVEGCDCTHFQQAAHGHGTLIVTPEQLQEGYRHSPYVRLGGHVVESEHGQFQVVARLDDGNYLVIDPRRHDA